MKTKSNLIFYFLSFFVPASIMLITLFSQGIFWNSSTTILASDSFHQYAIFDIVLRNTLHGSGSLFYSFTSGLGVNFYAITTYYLGSFLSPFVYFFRTANMPDAVYLFTIIKFGLVGLSGFYSFKRLSSNKVKPFFILLLSTGYALMSFSSSQIELTNWIDIFILIPLILLGLQVLLNQNKPLLYFVSLTLLFIQNYYFGYMVAIFVFLYFIVNIVDNEERLLSKIVTFIITSLLSTIASSITLLPTIIDLHTHGESLTAMSNLFNIDLQALDLVAKSFVGVYDTTKFHSIPMIYLGVFPLLLSFLFFTLTTVKKKTKIAYACFIIFIIASFYITPLNLFWQGFHSPNMFLYRYAWSLPLVMILLSLRTLQELNQIKLNHLLVGFAILFSLFFICLIYQKHYSFLKIENILFTFTLLGIYGLLLYLFKTYRISLIALTVFSFLFFTLETSVNTYYQLEGIKDEWNFPSKTDYNLNLHGIDTLVNTISTENNSFVRTETLTPQTGNDSMKYNYNGISQFSSIRNRASSSTLDKLGFKSDGTNLNLRYQNNTLLMDSLFAVKYNLTQSDPQKFGFSLFKKASGVFLYQNQYAGQVAFLTHSIYHNVHFGNESLTNQTAFMNQITGLNLNYYEKLYPLSSENTSILDHRTTVKSSVKNNQTITSATYKLKINHNSQLYLYLPNLTFSNTNSQSIIVSANGKSNTYSIDDALPLFNAGYFKKGETISISLIFPDNDEVSYDTPQFFSLNIAAYQKAMQYFAKQSVSVTDHKNSLSVKYQTKSKRSLFFTIPYDNGWKAYQNGKEIPISKAQKGFMKVTVKKGSGKIKLVFIPQGFILGSILSITATILFGIFLFILIKKDRHDKKRLSQK